MPIISGTCEHCLGAFAFSAHRLKRGGGRFCSKRCATLSWRKRASVNESRACKQCGGPFFFTTFPSALARQRGQFCSSSCRGKYQRGTLGTNWRGGKFTDSTGRTWIFQDNAQKRYQYEYRLMVEAMIGRPLASGEVVHHINGNPSDNSPENLLVMSNREHVRLHAQQRYQAKCDEQGRKICRQCLIAQSDDAMRVGKFLCKNCYNTKARETRKALHASD